MCFESWFLYYWSSVLLHGCFPQGSATTETEGEVRLGGRRSCYGANILLVWRFPHDLHASCRTVEETATRGWWLFPLPPHEACGLWVLNASELDTKSGSVQFKPAVPFPLCMAQLLSVKSTIKKDILDREDLLWVSVEHIEKIGMALLRFLWAHWSRSCYLFIYSFISHLSIQF